MSTSPASLAPDTDLVILVGPDDAAIGVAPKLDAHRAGWLHRAVSVMLFDASGRLLIQQRAAGKYHSGGLWSNTCCGHPRPGEGVADAGNRRLEAELGIPRCELVPVSDFVYFARVDGGLVEHELDHVLVGEWSGDVRPDPSEVSAVRWIEPAVLLAELSERPSSYTPWMQRVTVEAWTHRQALRNQARRVDGGLHGG